MKLKCKNPRCMERNNGKSYSWDYLGGNPFYASCPRCKSSIKIPKIKKKDNFNYANDEESIRRGM